MAILRGLLFHWSAMTWFLGMDIRLRLGRERFERAMSELKSSESQDPILGSKITESRVSAEESHVCVPAPARFSEGSEKYGF
jgi:hypothetical protein